MEATNHFFSTLSEWRAIELLNITENNILPLKPLRRYKDFKLVHV
jgi:hypothetical protein